MSLPRAPVGADDPDATVHTVTLLVRVRSKTPEEARFKISSLFGSSPAPWPRGSWSIQRIRRGWKNR